MGQQRSKAIAYGYQPRGNPTQPVNKSQIATNTEDDGNALNALFHKFMAFYYLPIQAGGKLELVTQVYRLFDEVNGTDLVFPNVGQAMSHTLKQNKRARFSDELATITYIDKWQQKSKATPYVYKLQRNPTKLVNESQIATFTEDVGNAFFSNI